MSDKVYLWVNLPDLSVIGTIGPFGSPLNMMVQSDLGDELLPGGAYDHNSVDHNYVLVHCAPERAEAIQGGLEVIGKTKLRRKLRTRITAKLPTNGKWRTFN